LLLPFLSPLLLPFRVVIPGRDLLFQLFLLRKTAAKKKAQAAA
jgi:hypothetical protein